MDSPAFHPAEYAADVRYGREYGQQIADSLRHNLRLFWRGVHDREIGRSEVTDAATEHADRLPLSTRAELYGMADATGVPYTHLLAFNLFEETLISDGCTVAIAAGDAGYDGDTVFFKQSDKKGADEFVGEDYHQHQQINVVRVEDRDDKNRIITVTPAGSTSVKMGINEKGVAIGANMSRTTTFDEEGKSSKEWAAASRGEYMRQGLFHGDTAKEVAAHIIPMLFEDPMSSPGNIDIADADEAVIIEGEFTHLASEWVADDVIARANKFQVLDQLARPREEIPSSYARYERAMSVLEDAKGDVDVETLRALSMDHTNGPGLSSICRHQENDYADETSLSSAVFDIDGDNPEDSRLYFAVGKPCHAWRSEEGEGWFTTDLSATADDIPERFRTGEAWLEFYDEEPNPSDADAPPIN